MLVRPVRNLWLFIDADLAMRSHVTRHEVTCQCFAVLRHLWLISRLLSHSTLKMVSPITTGLSERCADWSASNLVKRLLNASNLRTLAIQPCRCIGCPFQSVSHSNWWSWSTEFFMAVFYLGCPTLQVNHHCVLHHLIPPVRSSTVSARALPVYGSALWNSLPADITSIDNLPVFHHYLKNVCFCTRIQEPLNSCISFSIIA